MPRLYSRLTLLLSALAPLAIGVGATAPAHADAPAPQIKVAYNDLDLQSIDGQKRLSRRVWVAAREVCSANDFDYFLSNRCRRIAVDGARRQLAAAGVETALR